MITAFRTACLAFLVCGGLAAGDAVAHPYIWWTREDAAAIKARIDAGGDAAKQLQITRDAILKSTPKAKPLWDLFQWMVNGDEAARDRQLAALRTFIGTQPETDVGGRWVVNNASANDRHMRDEQSMNALRYDMLYDHLTPLERAGVENTFRVYIEFQLSGHRPIHPHFGYGRTDTLPNMHWPRGIGTHLMAVALGDEAIIKQVWEGYGGWFWFFDQYLADGFYMEEFAKYYSNVGTMLLVCEGLERLGLGERYGYGYVSKSGATVRDFLFMPTRIAYPMTDFPGGTPMVGVVQMGDTAGRSPLAGIVNKSFVNGRLRAGAPRMKGLPNGNGFFTGPRMNGPFPKMLAPLWCEVGHRRFPDAGFDWFLAQMRGRDDAKAYPTLLFGLDPIDPAEVEPPAPKSIVSTERGFAFLKADESKGYYTSGNPAVALQFGMYYVHYAHDCFSLLGYHGFGRPLYCRAWGGGKAGHVKNQSIATGGKGYIGGHAWHDTPRGHSGVTVDNLKPRPVDHGQNGCTNQRIRQSLEEPVKVVAVAADGLYPGVWQERALFLTKEYLVDCFANRSGTKRRYEWGVNGAGTVNMEGWEPTTELNGSMLYRDLGDPQPEGYDTKRDANDPIGVHKQAVGAEPWSTHILQDCHGVEPGKSALGPEWYARQVGVRISMLGAEGTTVFGGRPPIGGNGPLDKLPTYGETGGAWLNVRRETDKTNFIAVHEPFDQGAVPTTTITKMADTDDVMAVALAGTGGVAKTPFDDRALMATGKDITADRTVTHGDETYVFASHLWVRIGSEQITVVGYPRKLVIPVTGTPKLVLNGKAVEAAVDGGVLTWTGTVPVPPLPKAEKPVFDNEIDRLIHQLSDPNTGSREKASITLARMGAKAAKAIPAIARGITDKKTVGNKIAAEVLCWMGPAALPTLGELLTHEDPFVRAEVLFGLQSYTGDISSILPKIEACLADDNRYVRRNALKMIIKQGPAAAAVAPKLVQYLTDHVNRRHAIYALAAIGEAAVPLARDILTDPKTDPSALDILATMEPGLAAPALDDIVPALDGPYAAKALAALEAVGKKAVTKLDRVLPLLKSEDGAVVNAAARLITSWHPLPESAPDPVPALVAAAKTPGPEGVYRCAVIRALGVYPGEATTALLTQAMGEAELRIDDRKGGQGLLLTMALNAAADDAAVQDGLAVLFTIDKRRKRLAKRRQLLKVLPHPKFPLAKYRSEIEGKLLKDKEASMRSLGAAAILNLEPDNAAAAKLLTDGLVVVNEANRRGQARDRDAAWRQLPFACRGGWQLDWKTYLEHADADVRARALKAAVKFPAVFAAHAAGIAALLEAEEANLAIAAATALVQADAPQAPKALEVYLDLAAKQPWSRKAQLVGAVGSLGKKHKDLVTPRLLTFTQDTDFFVRKAAEGALLELSRE